MRKIFEFRISSFQFPVSSFVSRIGGWVGRLAVIAVIFATAQAAHAQGCAMCANNASAVREGAVRSLQNGILILLIPVVLMVAGIAVVVFRRRNTFYGEGIESEGGWDDNLSSVPPLPPDLLREARLEVHEESETAVGAQV